MDEYLKKKMRKQLEKMTKPKIYNTMETMTYLADAMRFALCEALSKSLWMIRTLSQVPISGLPSPTVRKFLKEQKAKIFKPSSNQNTCID